MRKSRLIPAGLALLLAVLAACYLYTESNTPKPTIGLRYAYLLVSIEAKPDWTEKYRATIEWNGREVQLPVVFRCRITEGRTPDWGAVPEEARKALMIQGQEIPVCVEPLTPLRVSNEPVMGLIPELIQPSEKILSYATWVSVGPTDRLSTIPVSQGKPMHLDGTDVAKKVELLIADGKVIEVDIGP